MGSNDYRAAMYKDRFLVVWTRLLAANYTERLPADTVKSLKMS